MHLCFNASLDTAFQLSRKAHCREINKELRIFDEALFSDYIHSILGNALSHNHFQSKVHVNVCKCTFQDSVSEILAFTRCYASFVQCWIW